MKETVAFRNIEIDGGRKRHFIHTLEDRNILIWILYFIPMPQ